MTKYVVIDTNIIVSALLKVNSIPDKIMQMIYGKLITPILNDSILAEYIDVLNRGKFPFDKKDIEKIINIFKNRSLIIEPKKYNNELIDEDDRMFYEVLLASKEKYNSYLITGNIKHFPKDERVLTPREFMEQLNQQ